MTILEDSFAELVATLGQIKEHIADDAEAKEKAAFAVVLFLRDNNVPGDLVDPLWTLCCDVGEQFVQTPGGYRKRTGNDAKLDALARNAACVAAVDLLIEEGLPPDDAFKKVCRAKATELSKTQLKNLRQNESRKSRKTSEFAQLRILAKDHARKNGGVEYLLDRLNSTAKRM
jgi:hypothetical protein